MARSRWQWSTSTGDGIPDLAACGGCGGKFGPPTLLVANLCSSLVAADFNGDGKPDSAVAGSDGTQGEVAILLNLRNGTFAPPVYYATQTGEDSASLAVGDFNNDGTEDLAVAGYGVGILLGNGDGTFGVTTEYAPGTTPNSIVVADSNEDGKPDLATTSVGYGYGPYSVSVFLGNGDGTFQTPINKNVTFPPFALAAGDFNGDGLTDLAIVGQASNNNTAEILLGKGAGRFQVPVGYALSGQGESLGVGDFNSDGKSDVAVATIATANMDIGAVSFFLGNGDGTFQTPLNFATDSSPFGLAVADLNGDSLPDVVTANYNAYADLSVLINSGLGPGIEISPQTLTFTTQLAGTLSASQTLTVTNTGLAALSILSVVPSSGFNARSNCGSSIGVGRSCTVSVGLRAQVSGYDERDLAGL